MTQLTLTTRLHATVSLDSEEVEMETESNRDKQVMVVDKHAIRKECPMCGYDEFRRRPGIHLGQQMECQKCGYYFRSSDRLSASEHSVQEHGHADGSGEVGKIGKVVIHKEHHLHKGHHHSGYHHHR
jgi:predicted RNA-binding Zn-ribbon protein involved in translation (DUF1610 family)